MKQETIKREIRRLRAVRNTYGPTSYQGIVAGFSLKALEWSMEKDHIRPSTRVNGKSFDNYDEINR